MSSNLSLLGVGSGSGSAPANNPTIYYTENADDFTTLPHVYSMNSTDYTTGLTDGSTTIEVFRTNPYATDEGPTCGFILIFPSPILLLTAGAWCKTSSYLDTGTLGNGAAVVCATGTLASQSSISANLAGSNVLPNPEPTPPNASPAWTKYTWEILAGGTAKTMWFFQAGVLPSQDDGSITPSPFTNHTLGLFSQFVWTS